MPTISYWKRSFKIRTGLIDRLYVSEGVRGEWAFVKSEFPYNLECEDEIESESEGEGKRKTNHWVLWNSLYSITMEFDEKQINEMLEDTLKEIVGSDAFDFAWYINPCPSIPELWHCHVFWVRL